MMSDDEGWCIECGDTFRYDDCGGYNPPCECGYHCRSCHAAEEARRDPDDDYERDEDSYPDTAAARALPPEGAEP